MTFRKESRSSITIPSWEFLLRLYPFQKGAFFNLPFGIADSSRGYIIRRDTSLLLLSNPLLLKDSSTIIESLMMYYLSHRLWNCLFGMPESPIPMTVSPEVLQHPCWGKFRDISALGWDVPCQDFSEQVAGLLGHPNYHYLGTWEKKVGHKGHLSTPVILDQDTVAPF